MSALSLKRITYIKLFTVHKNYLQSTIFTINLSKQRFTISRKKIVFWRLGVLSDTIHYSWWQRWDDAISSSHLTLRTIKSRLYSADACSVSTVKTFGLKFSNFLFTFCFAREWMFVSYIKGRTKIGDSEKRTEEKFGCNGDEVTLGSSKMTKGKRHRLYSPPTIRMIKSRRVKWGV
jgi:hypothetical protein